MCDPTLPDRVQDVLLKGARCLVIEDSLHVYKATSAALRGFGDFVPLGGFLVVEEGCVDVEEMRLDATWPRGVLPAIADWLDTPEGRRFPGQPRPGALWHVVPSRRVPPARPLIIDRLWPRA